MFTGLIEGVGKVKSLEHVGGDIKAVISPLFEMADLIVGESVSVDGICLTVTSIMGDSFSVDVSNETFSRSTLAHMRQGHEVNLERALRPTDRLGGHFVSGHVDGTGTIINKKSEARSWVLTLAVDEGLSQYIIEKGSVAIDGVSLTVNRCDKSSFDVNIIPETGRQTTLLKKGVNSVVNIETDLIGKYVHRFFKRYTGGEEEPSRRNIDFDMLKKHGFGD
ncbi:MAG: riboflavin synthase [Desulfatiglans sp.]|jgi:riboflavin synthase|nr:riboflavin synthase [Thermodesulfobacteriota bacterium]MEE4352018.1 riboflavin synthase [Desulfatiglans sp.]